MGETQETGTSTLTGKQQRFIAYYLKNPNAANAARLAGYAGDPHTLEQVAYENLRKPVIKAEIDRLRKERKLSPDAVLGMIEGTASVDLTPYVRDDGTLDVQALGAAGLGYLVEGSKPGRNGAEIALASPQTARKMLARHHRLLGSDVQVDITHTTLDAQGIGALVDQLAAIKEQAADGNTTEQDDAE